MLLIKKAARHADTPRVQRDTEREIEGQSKRAGETASERDRKRARERVAFSCFRNTLVMPMTLAVCVVWGRGTGWQRVVLS